MPEDAARSIAEGKHPFPSRSTARLAADWNAAPNDSSFGFRKNQAPMPLGKLPMKKRFLPITPRARLRILCRSASTLLLGVKPETD